MVTVDVAVVLQGSRLCVQSARRLNAAARMLINSRGDTGIVFGLWSLAVEELGKSVLLTDQIINRRPGELVSVQPGFDHRRSLPRGLDELPEIRNAALVRALRVAIASADPIEVSDPLVPTTKVSAVPWTTGLFEDTSGDARVAPTVDLRFTLLYVEWDSEAQRWTDSRLPHEPSKGVMQWQISEDDLRRFIDVLDTRLHAA